MKIKVKNIIGFGIISIVISGCPVLTTKPIGNPVSAEKLFKFIGEWEIIDEEEIKDTVVIGVNSIENSEISLISTKDLKSEKIVLREGEKYSFFHIHYPKPYGERYVWGIVQDRNDSMKFSYPDPKMFEKAAKSKRIKAKIISKENDGSNSQVVIDDKVENIERYISKYNENEILTSNMIFRRVNIQSDKKASANAACIIRLQKVIENSAFNKITISPGLKILVQYDDSTAKRGGRMNCIYDSQTHRVDSIWGEK